MLVQIDGTPFDFSIWNPNEPDNLAGRQYCVRIGDTSTVGDTLIVVETLSGQSRF